MTAIPARVAGVARDRAVRAARPTGGSPAVDAGRGRDRRRSTRCTASAAPRRSPPWPTAPRSVRPVDVIVGPGNVYVALAKREVAGVVGVPSAFAGPSEVVVVADDTTAAELAAVDVIVQAEHGPGGLAWLVTWSEAAADAVDCRDRPAWWPVRPGATRSRRRSPAAATPCSSTGPSRPSRSSTSSRPSTSSCSRRPRGARCRSCATPAPSSAGPGRPASVGDYVAGPSHVLPTDGIGPVRQRAHGRRLPEARPRRHARPRGARPGGARTSGASPTAEGLAAHAESVRLPARLDDRATMSRDPAARRRRALRATTRPRSTSTVRLNTNESPDAAAGRVASTRCAEAVARIEWHRYPDRAATELRDARSAALARRRPEQVFAANGSNEVLQTLLLTYGGPGRTVADVRADLRAAHPHRPDHRHRASSRASGADDFTLDLDEVAPRARPRPSPPSRSCARRTTRPAWSSPKRRSRACSPPAPGLVVVDEAYGQFAPWSALELVDDDAPLVVTRTYSKTWSMAAARLGYLVGPAWVVAELEKVVLPYHLDARQAGGRARSRSTSPTRWRPGSPRSSRSGGGWSPRCADLAGRRVAVGRQLRAVPARGRRRRTTVWQRLLDRAVLVRDCSSWPRLDGCLRVTIGTPTENDALPRRARRRS